VEEIVVQGYYNAKVISKAVEIWRDLRKGGAPIDGKDLLIGATAIAKELPLWTCNI